MKPLRHILLLSAALLAPGAPAVLAAAEAADASAAAPANDQHLGSDIVGIYDTAVANLEQICDDYRRIKAIQQAKQLDIPYDEAYRNISSVMPVLDPVDAPLLRRAIRHPDDIATHKHAVEKVETQIEMMIDLAAKLLEEIEVIQVRLLDGGEMAKRPEATLEEIVQKPEYDPDEVIEIAQVREGSPAFAQLEELAKDDEKQQFKDLTPLMHELMPDIKDLTKETQEGEERPRDLFRSSDNPAALMRITDPEAPHTFGRKIGDGGAPVEWLFVNSWYTIGPFPNPMRINIHTKFPPETVVDLAATYVGKDGRLLRWEWEQSGVPMVQPSAPDQYGVYYAYTEISCDRPMDLWVAVGSDDKANVWLNGMPIWVSSDRLKGWRVNEGFRKVTFRRGINKVLYRVENGWLNIGFSMAIRVAP